MHYGVRRLVAINSGNYSYADIDLSNPVHLAAPNNRGKTTLVKALQFLYIDDFHKMKFGRRSPEDSKKHYFGNERSYLVFECHTPSGPQCLMARGLGNLKAGNFERYVYEGAFHENDYLDKEEILGFDDVKTRLADRRLTQIKKSDLWQVLSGSSSYGNGKAIPQLNILPTRRREEYITFRNIFVRLLSLINADARTLKQLIIESHAREVGERKIDVAADYKNEFERAERSEQRLNFIQTVADEIDEGKRLRLEIQSLTENITQTAPLLWKEVEQGYHLIESELQRLYAEQAQLEQQRQQDRTTKEQRLTARGTLNEKFKNIQEKWERLQKNHEKWANYSDEWIRQIRKNARQKAVQINELERDLEQTEKLDLPTIRQRISELEKQIAIDRRVLDEWDRTVISELRRAGISDDELDSVFRLLNPDLLKLIFDEAVVVSDKEAILKCVRAIAQRVKRGLYTDSALEINLSDVAGPESLSTQNSRQLQKQSSLKEQEHIRLEALLNTAENQKNARNKLNRLRNEYDQLHRDLTDYDRHLEIWSRRGELETELSKAQEQTADIETEIDHLQKQLNEHAKTAKGIEEKRIALQKYKQRLASTAQELQKEFQRLDLDQPLFSSGQQTTQKAPVDPQFLESFVESVAERLSNLAEDSRRIAESRSQLKRIQETIAHQSKNFESQQCYFSDEEEEWRLLVEARESLPQIEQTTTRNWDDLFTILSARLEGIVTAVRNIKAAVDQINHGLKSYQVSNLRAVDIKVKESHDTYPAIEALSGAGNLFDDPDAVQLAKKRLRQMIESNETIELDSLFELRIQIQHKDGSWRQAASLDEIGSTGTGMTAKAMIFIQLIRAITGNEKYSLHFYIDGLGELDDQNLEATMAMAVSKGVIPITADPRLHLEPLAHPQVTVYSLGQSTDGRFFIDRYKTYQARRQKSDLQPAENSDQ